MSEDNLNLEETEVHYVYGDSEYVLGEEELNPELRDLICNDGSRAILVDGQYIVTDNQAIFLQGGAGDSNLTQFYINDNSEGFVVDGEESSSSAFFESDCVQVVEDETSGGPQIIYYTNEDSNTEDYTPVQELKEEDITSVQDEDGNIYPFKRIKLEGQLLNFEEFVQQQASMATQDMDDSESMEYAILEDGITLQSDESTSFEKVNQIVDLSRITGRNLITGQTVTLHSYMEKLTKRLNKSNSSSQSRRISKKIYDDITNVTLKSPKPVDDDGKKPELSDLLDKKISIGTTKSGKKIVGKIIHVEQKNVKKPEPVVNDRVPEIPDAIGDDKTEDEEEEVTSHDAIKILIKKCTVSIDGFEQISKTLGGVMEMESVRKKLENKNIVVKLVEKKYKSETDSFIKMTSYSYGYMEQELSDGGSGEIVEKWKFVPDQDTQDVLLGDHLGSNEEGSSEKKSTKFPITTSLTILITYEKVGTKTIRVNLNPALGNMCTICAQYFKNNLQLRLHMNQVHNTYFTNSVCEVCEKVFDDPDKLQEHRTNHVQEGRLFLCTKCSKSFTTQAKLQKHLPMHDIYSRPLECSFCGVRCASEWALKKHLMTHTGIKLFVCNICNKQFLTHYDMKVHKKIHFPEKHFACNVCMRTFSRHSNLLRHTEIHKGTGALYKCDICGCSYNYISSLTRHMVQNHVDAGDTRKNDDKE